VGKMSRSAAFTCSTAALKKKTVAYAMASQEAKPERYHFRHTLHAEEITPQHHKSTETVTKQMPRNKHTLSPGTPLPASTREAPTPGHCTVKCCLLSSPKRPGERRYVRCLVSKLVATLVHRRPLLVLVEEHGTASLGAERPHWPRSRCPGSMSKQRPSISLSTSYPGSLPIFLKKAAALGIFR
jgi:hypothetical protein